MLPTDANFLVTPDLSLMWPELIVLGLTIVLMALDAFVPDERHFKLLTAVSLVGYGLAAAALWTQDGRNAATFSGAFRADGLTVFLSLVVLLAAVLTVMTGASYVERLEGRMPIGEFYVLLALSTLGALLVAAAGDLVMVFVGIELSSLAVYVLTAFAKRRATAIEGALKYFLLGIFASSILVYGMAWMYGLTGTTNLDGIAATLQGAVAGQQHLEPALLLAVLLAIVGLGFKMAAVPFHFWTPDAYDGAPTPVTAFMSVVPKVAAFAAAIRILVQALGPLTADWTGAIAALAILTMVFGNVVAVSQRNVKRMLAYSSVAHTGYIMVGLAVYQAHGGYQASATPLADDGIASILFYLLAYTVMNVGAFAVVAWLQHRGRGLTLDDFSGLGTTEPAAAAAMTVFMVSLMGIPPTVGFYAKYRLIVAAIQTDQNVGLWLAIVIVLMSAISAFYYLRVVAVMYFNDPARTPRQASTPLLNLGIGIMAVASLIGGIFLGNQFYDLATRWYHALEIVTQAAMR